MSKQRDTWGRPNLVERFIHHTKLGRWYASCGRDEFDVIRIVVLTGSVCLGLAIAAAIITIMS